MEVSVKNLTDVSREVEITAPASEIQHHFEKAYQEYRPKVELKGFRKGKAPLELVKKLYGDMIEQETLTTVANELYKSVVKEKNLKPIGEPAIVDMDYKKGDQVRFKIHYDIRPDIKLKQYKGIEINKQVHTVTDVDVQNEITRLKKMNSTTTEAEQVTDEEYVVTADVQEVDKNGVPLIGKKQSNAKFYLADPQLEQALKDALKATKAGSLHTVSFQHKHEDHTHDVSLAVTVTKVEKVVLPEFTEEFVKKITDEKMSSKEEFLKNLHADLVAYWNEKSRRQVLNDLVTELIKRHDFQVPESLIRSVLQSLLEDVREQYPNKQLPQQFNLQKFFEQNHPYAVFQSKWALLREELLKAEKIEVEESDWQQLADREASKIGIDKEKLIAYYKSSEQVKERIIGDKLIDLLLKNSKIKEVEMKELPE